MKGQWVGKFSGNQQGHITVHLDEVDDHYEGAVILHGPGPIAVAVLATPNKKASGRIHVPQIARLHPITLAQLTAADLAKLYPGQTFSEKADVDYSFTANELQIQWATPEGFTGSAKLPVSEASKPSAYKGKTLTWPKFKVFADSQPYRRIIFRGQEDRWRLRTAYHRSGRSNLGRYVDVDMKALYSALAGRTRHLYDIRIPEHNAALLHLAQHHGYPTPLLDWTFSPYVAAFNAFRNVKGTPGPDDKVRILMFDHVMWQRSFTQIMNLATPILHLSVLESVSFDNDRVGPQQALSLVTNIDDVEGYIRRMERKHSKKFLTVIDIPASERARAMEDLARMGISAGAMFPGLDGTCEALKERMFPRS